MARATRFDSKSRWGFVLAAIGGLGLAAATGAAACVQPPSYLNASGSGGSGGGGGAGAGGSAADAGAAVNEGKKLFTALEPDMVQACASCHVPGGVADMPFLAGPDRYHQSITSWPGIIAQDPTESKLETVPVTGTMHPVQLDQPPYADTLFPKIKQWLAAEAKGIVTKGTPDAGKLIDPFVPIIGFNAVYLTPLGPQFTGMAVTFNAGLIDANALELTDIEVHPTAMDGIHVVHPLFVVYPVGMTPDPDPVDSFSNVDQYFQPGQAGTLGPGTLILTNWVTDGKLSIAFETVEIVQPMSDAGMDSGTTGGGGCKDVNSFQQNALPELKSNCVMCHGGGNPAAMGAIDMSAANTDPAAICAQVRNRVSPADPPSSQIFVTTDPGGNAAHPYKFGGVQSKFDAFKSSVSTWIQAEQ